ncbi:MAG: hypothetical protein GF346_03035, partial [Candidatus Eisenbacteria bacterium]|nr:hypothetical protein [Candidatus Latescibacterota bacterium]MBD3301396.1 hypothetical protein [Candidatus Eisenbacteria bacterium]
MNRRLTRPRPGRSDLRIRSRLLIAFVGLALALSVALTILMERTARRGLE